jgi:hypothetical protein
VEVEAIGRVRHKNLVRLLGYCAEGAHRYRTLSRIDDALPSSFSRLATCIASCGNLLVHVVPTKPLLLVISGYLSTSTSTMATSSSGCTATSAP